ncbi:hypothetical protein [Fluviicola sp.]|uniref:hypothetical protein n=1 Tax=Fluviicola sp. TaxID=1917219 RepID=UPI002635795B|nr:hypothetical protein [Fluviicola sp.]
MFLFGKLTKRLAAKPKLIFLIDGIGAAVSAFFLGIVLTAFERFFGMPKCILTPLSFVALIFAVYSLCCYFFARRNWPRLLFLIGVLNVIYCLFTSAFLLQFLNQLSAIGVTYFIFEILIILTLASIELRICSVLGQESEELL